MWANESERENNATQIEEGKHEPEKQKHTTNKQKRQWKFEELDGQIECKEKGSNRRIPYWINSIFSPLPFQLNVVYQEAIKVHLKWNFICIAIISVTNWMNSLQLFFCECVVTHWIWNSHLISSEIQLKENGRMMKRYSFVARILISIDHWRLISRNRIKRSVSLKCEEIQLQFGGIMSLKFEACYGVSSAWLFFLPLVTRSLLPAEFLFFRIRLSPDCAQNWVFATRFHQFNLSYRMHFAVSIWFTHTLCDIDSHDIYSASFRSAKCSFRSSWTIFLLCGSNNFQCRLDLAKRNKCRWNSIKSLFESTLYCNSMRPIVFTFQLEIITNSYSYRLTSRSVLDSFISNIFLCSGIEWIQIR